MVYSLFWIHIHTIVCKTKSSCILCLIVRKLYIVEYVRIYLYTYIHNKIMKLRAAGCLKTKRPMDIYVVANVLINWIISFYTTHGSLHHYKYIHIYCVLYKIDKIQLQITFTKIYLFTYIHGANYRANKYSSKVINAEWIIKSFNLCDCYDIDFFCRRF